MNKKFCVVVIALIVLCMATGAVFAQDECNYYESGTAKISTRVVSVSENGKTVTIDVKSYVDKERIEIYKVVVGDTNFTDWDISGTTQIGPHGSTTIKVTKTSGVYRSTPAVKVYLKTCL